MMAVLNCNESTATSVEDSSSGCDSDDCVQKDCPSQGFFRRSIQQKIQYRPCTKNQQCSILRINRNRCQYCRLKKCIAVGMSRDGEYFSYEKFQVRENGAGSMTSPRRNVTERARALKLRESSGGSAREVVDPATILGHFNPDIFESCSPLLISQYLHNFNRVEVVHSTSALLHPHLLLLIRNNRQLAA